MEGAAAGAGCGRDRDGVVWGSGGSIRGAEEAQERVRCDDVHGDPEGLRVLRGDEGADEIPLRPLRRRRSRPHCLP